MKILHSGFLLLGFTHTLCILNLCTNLRIIELLLQLKMKKMLKKPFFQVKSSCAWVQLLLDTRVDGASTQVPLLEVTRVHILLLHPWTITSPWLPLGRLHLALDTEAWDLMLVTSRDRSKLRGTTFILQ